MSGGGIRTDFWIEGRLEAGHTATKAGYHIGDDMVGANAQPLTSDL